MWKHVLPPVVIVIVFWLTVSLTTTVFISYQERTHQRILEENVASAIATGELQTIAWRLLASVADEAKSVDDFTAAVESHRRKINETLLSIRAMAQTPTENLLLAEVDGCLRGLDGELQIQRVRIEEQGSNDSTDVFLASVRPYVETIDTATSRMRQYHQMIIDTQGVEQRQLLSRMMLARNFGIVLGPIIGVILGWRLTARLQRHVSTLAITLRDAPSSRVREVGEVSLRRADGLREVQELSERVVQRMKNMLIKLERAEQEVIQSERLAAVGELAAGVAHELRNPLTSVKLLLQHAVSKKDREFVHVDNIELILREVARMEETIQGLLDFSRPAKMSSSVHDLRIPLQRAITLVHGRAVSHRVVIDYSPPDEPVFVDGDAEQLHLVFVNLLINAIEAIGADGNITVSVRQSEADQTATIEFRDTGCGIPAAIMSRLFEPFATSKERGTGLGLALCHRVVTNHHGTIHAGNQATGGAVFEVRFSCISKVDHLTQIA